MLCDDCHEHDATVHYTEVIDEKMIKINLCQECAKAKGVEITEPFSVGEILGGFAAKDTIEVDDNLICPKCGLTISAFKKKGRFGCPGCYTTFGTVLTVLLKSIHKKVTHIGKKSQKLRKIVTVEEKKEKLKAQLDKAVAREDFEKAIDLRDKIKGLKENNRKK